MAMLLAIAAAFALVVSAMPYEAYAQNSKYEKCSAHGHGDDWAWRQDGNGHHHKHCYNCDTDFDFAECIVEWVNIDETTHQGRCKICREYTTGPQHHDKTGRKSVILNGGVHSSVPCCSVCGYVDPLDAHDYGLVFSYEKNAQGSLDSACSVERKICGEASPYWPLGQVRHGHAPEADYYYNYSTHWCKCYLCGQTYDHEGHDWNYETVTNEKTGKKSKKKTFCKICGFDPRYNGSNNNKEGHTHEWEYISDAGYHRQWCKTCGMPKGPAEKCTGSYTITEKGHTLTCSKCHGTYTELHELEESGSTDEKCNARCVTCGWIGEWPSYFLTDTISTCHVAYNGTHHFGMAQKQGSISGNDLKHTKECLDCGHSVTEDCDFVTDGEFYFMPENLVRIGVLHDRVCVHCGNRSISEDCVNFDYEQIGSDKWHKKTCHDCGQKWRNNGYERHNMVLDGSRSTDTTHTFVCEGCGYSEIKNHTVGKYKENVEWHGGTLYTWNEVRYCKVCNKVLSREQKSAGEKDRPRKQQNHGGGKVKVRRPQKHRKDRSNWGIGQDQVDLDMNLLPADLDVEGLVEDMAENPGNYLPNDFNLQEQINTHRNELPAEAEPYDHVSDAEGNITSTSGNTRVVLSPFVELSVVAFDEENPSEITYTVVPYFDAYLSTEISGTTTEVQIINGERMNVDYPVGLSLPVPAESFLYDKSVVVEHELGDATYYYLGTRSADDSAPTVSFVSEQGLPDGGTFRLIPSEHKLTYVEAKAPTRFAAGNIAYYACEEAECNKRFKDVSCTMELTVANCVLNQLAETVVNVSFDANGGSGTMSGGTYYIGDTYQLPACAFTPPEGMKFDCWNIGYAGDEFIPMTDLTLKAQWIGENESPTDTRECTITFDKSVDADHEVNGTMEPQTFQRGIPGQLNENRYSRPGYVFYGWSPTGSSNDAIVDMGTATFYCDTELTAVWHECVTLTFNANGGEGSMGLQIVEKSVYAHLDKNQFTRLGYKFIGWNTNPNATSAYINGYGHKYTDCAYVAQSEDKNLYAIWQKQATIHFDPNCTDATLTGEMPDQYASKLEYLTFNKCTYKRDGYTFLGWNKTAEATTVLYKDEYRMLIGNEEPITLYAIWAKNNTITFDPNGASGDMEPQVIATGKSANLSKCTFTKNGYTFYGWTPTESYKNTKNRSYQDEALKYMSATDGDMTLYAIWIKDVTIHFDKNSEDATGSMEDQATDNLTSASLKANAFARTGYQFKGWSEDKDADTPEYSDGYGYFQKDEDTTLYAVWHKNITVTYDKNASDASGIMSSTTAIDRKYFTLRSNTFSRPGYTFGGWGETADAWYPVYSDGCEYAYFTDDVTLYAIWNKDVTLTFEKNADDATGTMAAQTMKDRTYTEVNPNTFERTGFEFVGWSERPTATLASSSDEGLAFLTEDSTWYAVWKPVTAAAVSSSVEDSLTAVAGKVPENMTDEEKTDASEAVNRALNAVLSMRGMEDVDMTATVLASQDQLAQLEEAAAIYSEGSPDNEKGVELVYDQSDAPAALTGDFTISNALINAYTIGVEDPTETTADGKTAITFEVGTADDSIYHGFAEGFDRDSAITFSMTLNNVARVASGDGDSGSLAVPTIISMPVPEGFRDAETLAVFHHDENGDIMETISPALSNDRTMATFPVSGFSDFTLAKNGNFAALNPVVTPPTAKAGLTYNGSPQVLIDEGTAEGGVMYYAVTTKDSRPSADKYSRDLPTATNVGTYYVWYKVVGDGSHKDTAPQRIETEIVLAPSLAGGRVTAPAGARLILASYDILENSKDGVPAMTGVREAGIEEECVEADPAALLKLSEIPAGGCKLLLLDPETGSPLCEAFDPEG